MNKMTIEEQIEYCNKIRKGYDFIDNGKGMELKDKELIKKMQKDLEKLHIKTNENKK